MSGAVQRFELVGVIGREMTGWECAGCLAHLMAEERDGRTYGEIAHHPGCSEVALLAAEPPPGETRSGLARIRALEVMHGELSAVTDRRIRALEDEVSRTTALMISRIDELAQSSAGVTASLAARADQQDEALGHLDEALKGLGMQAEQLRARGGQRYDDIGARIREQAQRSDGLDRRLTDIEVVHRSPGGIDERLRELEKAVLNPRGTVIDQFSDARHRLEQLELAVGGLVEHGPAGHALPRSGQAAAAGGPPRPSVQHTEWVVRLAADEDWTEAHLRNAIGDLPGLTVHQMSFIGSVTTAGGGQGSAHSAGEPGYVRASGTSSSSAGAPGGSGR